MIGASISTGTIWVFLSSHWALTFWGTTAVNCTGQVNLRSIITAPIRSGFFSENLGSGEKPSVKNTTSENFDTLKSIDLGGPSFTKNIHCSRAFFNGIPKLNEPSGGCLAYGLSEITRRKARPTLPQSWLAPNISFPLSFPADPGSSKSFSTIASISPMSSVFLSALISSTMSTKL